MSAAAAADAIVPARATADQRRGRNEAADRKTPAVAHEELRRVAVPAEETEQRARERDGKDRDHRSELRSEGPRERRGGDGGDAGGEPVHVVEQVDGVVDPAEPDDRRPWSARHASACS